MLQGLQNGYILPEIITEEQYNYIKNHKDEDKSLTGFVGFGCSFGGKWFGGLARNKRGDNYCGRANKSLLRDFETLKDAKFLNLDYREVIIPNNSVVYCDPPYANTTKYSTKDFNHKEFWEYMRLISKNNKVFISEQQAPEDFIPVWQKQVKRNLDVNKNNLFDVTEKLFVYRYGVVDYKKYLTN